MGDATRPVLNPDTIADLRKAQAEYGNPGFIRQLIEIYRTNAPGRIAGIREAIAARDASSLERIAHTLKSNCAMLGALDMAAICATLEANGETGAFDEAAATAARLGPEFEQVLRALEDLLGDSEPPAGAGTAAPEPDSAGREPSLA